MIRALLLAGLSLLGCSCATAGYLATQGRHLLGDSLGARPAKGLLASPQTDPQTRAFLLQAGEILRFATDVVGLKKNRSFTRYKEIARDHLVDVVSGCAADSFQPYTWRYPFLGRLPYRGYYKLADAEREAARLKAEGWDVLIRPVDSFSTLGFTRDPLYSFMKSYSAYELASLILHEQTHATLFVKGQTQFNEELASFVGEQGALVWLAQSKGPDSSDYREALDQIADEKVFESLARGLHAELDAVYRSELTRQQKLERKAGLIAAFQADFENTKSARFRTQAFRSMRAPRLNNAYLSLFSLYSDDIPLIRSYWQKLSGSDLRRLLAQARALALQGDVKEQMRRALETP